MFRSITTVAASAALVLGGAGAAGAYTGDPINTGTGFVGKGEVQTPWGWNNARLQSNASGVTFTVESDVDYSAVCMWVTGEGTRGEKEHRITRNRSTSVDKEVLRELRTNPKSAVTGFNLLGFGAVNETGTALPVEGEPCIGEGTGATWETVTELGSSGAALFAHYSGLPSIQLQDTNVTL